jgi:hypothetical protein
MEELKKNQSEIHEVENKLNETKSVKQHICNKIGQTE